MVWVFIIRLTIVVFGLVEARRARSRQAVFALATGPVAMTVSAWALTALSFEAAMGVATALSIAAATIGGATARGLYALADARRDDLTAREHLEGAANGVTAGAVFDGAVAFLCVASYALFASDGG